MRQVRSANLRALFRVVGWTLSICACLLEGVIVIVKLRLNDSFCYRLLSNITNLPGPRTTADLNENDHDLRHFYSYSSRSVVAALLFYSVLITISGTKVVFNTSQPWFWCKIKHGTPTN
jgi:hypothetical protein